MHNNLFSVLITWLRVASATAQPSGGRAFPPPAPGAAQAVAVDAKGALRGYNREHARMFDELQLPLLLPREYPSARTLCFRQAVVGNGHFGPAWAQAPGDLRSSVRATAADAAAVRTHAAAALALPPRPPLAPPLRRVAFLPRPDTRQFVGLPEAQRALAADGYDVAVVRELGSANFSFRDQVLSLWAADVVVSAHGAQLAYAFLARPGVSVIEYQPRERPPYRTGFLHTCFLLASTAAQQHYVRVGADVVLDWAHLNTSARAVLDDGERLRRTNPAAYRGLLYPPRRWPGGANAGMAHYLYFNQDVLLDVEQLRALVAAAAKRLAAAGAPGDGAGVG